MNTTRPTIPTVEAPELESGIGAALRSATRSINLDLAQMQTIGHLRRTARDIAGRLFGVQQETAEVVALQNSFEKALNSYCEAMKNPVKALAYVAPDAAHAQQAAQSPAEQANPPRDA